MTRCCWGWLSSALPAFINGYDEPALNAAERQQQTALTMAEEDDAKIRILQSLRGKICKCEADVSPPTGTGDSQTGLAARLEPSRGAALYPQARA